MNYSLYDLPDSGQNPVVYMDISLKETSLGRIYIRLFRDIFPAGVENFVNIAAGNTYRVITKGYGKYHYQKQIRRTYDGCKFYHSIHNNYLVSGDIYKNDGTNAGTIYCDQPIPPDFGDEFIPHETKGLVSLVPFTDEETGQIFYDSTFMITLDNAKPFNLIKDLDSDQIVIGYIYEGLDVLDKINGFIKPFAGKKNPVFVISHAGVYYKNRPARRHPLAPTRKNRKLYREPIPCDS
jgi:Peptidyl-prolyl cis-trans isomerase (rotamase) - cyclophilin family